MSHPNLRQPLVALLLILLAFFMSLSALARVFDSVDLRGFAPLSSWYTTNVSQGMNWILYAYGSYILTVEALLLLAVFFFYIIRLKWAIVSQESTSQESISQGMDRSIRYAITILPLVIIAIVLISIAESRAAYSLPSGGDDLAYIGTVFRIYNRGPIWAFAGTDRPFFFLFVCGLGVFADVGSAGFWTMFAVLSSAILLLAVYCFIRLNGWNGSSVYAPAIVAAVSVSAGFSRMSIDLFNSEFAIALGLLFSGLFLSERFNRSRATQALCSLFGVVLLLTYWYLFIIFSILIVAVGIILRRSMKRLAMVLMPAILMLLLFILVSIMFPPPIYWGIGSAISGTLSSGLPPWAPMDPVLSLLGMAFAWPGSEAIQIATGTWDPVFLLLVFAGLFMSFRIRPKPLSFLLVLLSLLAIGMMFLPILSLHASTLIPPGILAFVPFVCLLAPLPSVPGRIHSEDSGSGPKSDKRSIIGLALIVMLFLPLQTVVSYQMANNVPLVPPSSAAQQQLSWIGSHIGRNNATTILLVDNHYTYLWAGALATPNLYYGHLASAISGKADPTIEPDDPEYIGTIQDLWIRGISFPINTTRYHLIVTTQTYGPDPFEMEYLKEIGPGVFELKNLPTDVLMNFANSWIVWKETGNANTVLGTFNNASNIELGPTASWSVPNPYVSVSTSPSNPLAARLDLDVKPGDTFYAIHELGYPLNLSYDNILAFSFTISASSPVVVYLYLMGAPTFQNAYSYTLGTFQGHSVQEVIIGTYQLGTIGNPNLEKVTSISFNVYSQAGANVQIALSDMIAATSSDISNILKGATVSELGVGNLSNWSTPNPNVVVLPLGQSNSSAVVTMRIPATQTQFAVFETHELDLFNYTFIYVNMRAQATGPIRVSIVFQQNSTLFTNYAIFDAGWFNSPNGSIVEFAISPSDVRYGGNQTISGANVVSINVYSSQTVNASIFVYEIATVNVPS